MKRFYTVCTILAILCLLPFGLKAQENPTGAEFGMLMGDFKPVFIYGAGTDIALPAFLGPLIENGSATAFYSDVTWAEGAEEMYAVRVLAEHDVQIWGKLTLESGFGPWYFFNTAGGDIGRWGTMLGISFDTGPLEIRLVADQISVKNGPDMYAARLRLGFGL